ncbi:sulfite exporter TauE/SafE family protein [Vibrio sp. DW001]|uniref:sulfite exporter TauE/SafE family protein n=1 Tax=Vibrio sp. DW001 TaxID=2912315 RepID=UPI0023B12F0E|nr:sulfite exporter TauE/SafE family protein [Vibrio sp. DW001]WED28371.1 sulfite exporter TauE/SafE family protein [Vibrio sp. DW001]
MTSDWLGAMMVGFLGSAHCIGMCGGIATAMSINSVAKSDRLLTTLLYNTGRIISYLTAGAIVGGTISSAASLVTDYSILNWLRVLSAVVMIILALYIGKWWHGLVYVEKLGQHLWKHLSPFSKKLLPLPTPFHALPLGLLWGWLPCGLVYSALTWSAVSGSAVNGAAIMLAFGLGTLPSMLFMGVGAAYLNKLKNSVYFRQTGAVLLLSYGIYILVQTSNLLR